MRRLLRPIPLALVLVVLGLAVGSPQAGAITNGTLDTTHANVGVLYMNDRPVLSVGMCSGTLIAPQWFLVAAHCTAGLTAAGLAMDEINVSFDDTYEMTNGVLSTEHPLVVDELVTHPDYRGWPFTPAGPMVNDVGLVHLEEPVLGVPPADLPPVGFLDTQAAKNGLQGHEFVNVGYGMDILDRSLSSPQATITWTLQREVSLSPFLSLTPKNLNQQGGTCFGDSGGPHFYGGGYPNLEVAVSSTGAAVCKGGELNSNQRLDTPAVHDWLAQFTD